MVPKSSAILTKALGAHEVVTFRLRFSRPAVALRGGRGFRLVADVETLRFSKAPLSLERWKRLEPIFHAAVRMEHTERLAFLDHECADDEELRREALSLVAADDATGDFMPNDAFALGMEVLVSKKDQESDMDLEATQRYRLDPGPLPPDGRYRIVGPLAAGGMTEVYEAEDTNLSKRVVVKILKKEAREDPY